LPIPSRPHGWPGPPRGSGFIGHHVVDHLLAETDWEIIVLDSLSYAGDISKVVELSGFDVARCLLHMGYAALARLIEPAVIEPVILPDPDDDAVLACAVAAQAEAIVTGEAHLLDLKQYEGIPLLTAAQLLTRIEHA
jgi:nucleoside-diphosphate-sugar epimerase